MKSETAIREALANLENDLKVWQAKFEKAKDPTHRLIVGNTIVGVEGQKEALEWVLKGS